MSLNCQSEAGSDCLTIDDHRAASALTRAAADMRPGKTQTVAQQIAQQLARRDRNSGCLAIDDNRHGMELFPGNGHLTTPCFWELAQGLKSPARPRARAPPATPPRRNPPMRAPAT